MRNYNLSFISNQDLYNHVKDTIHQYRNNINLNAFNRNLVDPIKLIFDSKAYGKTMEELINDESQRQIDKSNSNVIGYFHQNIFKYIGGNDWEVPRQGFDVINENKKIYVEMKNKHNTMNSSSASATKLKMENKINEHPDNICLLVEVIATNNQDIAWGTNERIRRVSIDLFYQIVTNEANSFYNLVHVLPLVIEDVIEEIGTLSINNTVIEELSGYGQNTFNSLNSFAFGSYNGFNN
ncbi:Eco47II family restriction endonuclease [Aliarcobacter cryaerophilus]|uniref:Eco47II family restriction endonuclease n=1 Tax=Aliarcobacter cryaerophilus TaxID=28198 RepID=UPI000EAD1C14|nr:Eco47II family restriction endonuclease [Aliarcobacter cryaerophilus]AYJ78193.1 type IIP restriction/modification system, restriction endonuclease, AsuI family [Aliarcobacter cryaerophilus D2610]